MLRQPRHASALSDPARGHGDDGPRVRPPTPLRAARHRGSILDFRPSGVQLWMGRPVPVAARRSQDRLSVAQRWCVGWKTDRLRLLGPRLSHGTEHAKRRRLRVWLVGFGRGLRGLRAWRAEDRSTAIPQPGRGHDGRWVRIRRHRPVLAGSVDRPQQSVAAQPCRRGPTQHRTGGRGAGSRTTAGAAPSRHRQCHFRHDLRIGAQPGQPPISASGVRRFV